MRRPAAMAQRLLHLSMPQSVVPMHAFYMISHTSLRLPFALTYKAAVAPTGDVAQASCDLSCFQLVLRGSSR